jgi:hypothetical protein
VTIRSPRSKWTTWSTSDAIAIGREQRDTARARGVEADRPAPNRARSLRDRRSGAERERRPGEQEQDVEDRAADEHARSHSKRYACVSRFANVVSV